MPRSPEACAALLRLFIDGKLPMTEAFFEHCFDTITAMLEDANNERYRLRDQRKDQE